MSRSIVVPIVDIRTHCPFCGADSAVLPGSGHRCGACSQRFVPQELFVVCPNVGCGQDGSEIPLPPEALHPPGKVLQCSACAVKFRLPGRELRGASADSEVSAVFELPLSDHSRRSPSSRAPASAAQHPAHRLATLVEQTVGSKAVEDFLAQDRDEHGSRAETLVQFLLEEDSEDQRPRAIAVLSELFSVNMLVHVSDQLKAIPHARTMTALAQAICRELGYRILIRPRGGSHAVEELGRLAERALTERDPKALHGVGAQVCKVSEGILKDWVHFHASERFGVAYLGTLRERGWVPRELKSHSLDRVAFGSLATCYSQLTAGDERYQPDAPDERSSMPRIPTPQELETAVQLRNRLFAGHDRRDVPSPAWRELASGSQQIAFVIRSLLSALRVRHLFPSRMIVDGIIRDRHGAERYRCLMDDGVRRDVLTNLRLERGVEYLVTPSPSRVLLEPHVTAPV